MTLKLEEIERLNRARTQGIWIYNGNEIVDPLNPLFGIAGAYFDVDNRFIAAAPAITAQYLRARKFEVTEEFVEKVDAIVNKGHYLNWYEQDLGSVVKAALMAMWQEVEND